MHVHVEDNVGGIYFSQKYVKGHANSVGNNMADELARIGAAKYGNSKKWMDIYL